MDNYLFNEGTALTSKTPWPVVAISLWLRLGLIAAGSAVVGLTEFYNGEARLLGAFAWVFGSVFATAYSWRRAKILLDTLDDSDVAPKAAASDVAALKATTDRVWSRHDSGGAPVAPQARA
jgi:hypothetical protein